MAGEAPEGTTSNRQAGELDVWQWRVWLIDQPRRRAVKSATTRLAALIEASQQLHVDIGRVDAEVTRDG